MKIHAISNRYAYTQRLCQAIIFIYRPNTIVSYLILYYLCRKKPKTIVIGAGFARLGGSQDGAVAKNEFYMNGQLVYY